MLKKKSANFTKTEIDMMVMAIESRRGVLFGKLGVGLSAEMKKKAWEEVAAKVNEVGVGEMRTEKAVRKKWTDMSSLTKKKESARRREMKVTGGGECDVKMSDTELKVVDLLTEEAVGGVAGSMGIGLTEFQEEVETDEKYVLIQSEAGGSGVIDQEFKEVETTRIDKKTSGKRGTDVEVLTAIELKRLKVEEKKLEIEMRRLELEERRLKMEEERWELEKRRVEWLTASEFVQSVVLHNNDE